MHPEERAMVGSTFSFSDSQITTAVLIIGIAEVLFGLLWLFYRRKKHLFRIAANCVSFAHDCRGRCRSRNSDSSVQSCDVQSFANCSVSDWIHVSKDVPSAKSCKRKR